MMLVGAQLVGLDLTPIMSQLSSENLHISPLRALDPSTKTDLYQLYPLRGIRSFISCLVSHNLLSLSP